MKTNKLKYAIHFNAAFVGGFLGMYTIVNFNSLFGSAQTANLICLVRSLMDWNLTETVQRFGGMLLYMAGIALTICIARRSSVDLRLVSLLVDGAAATLAGFFPEDIPPILGLYPMFFAMAFQWNSFSFGDGLPSATIFSTNNLRQFSISVTEFCLTRDDEHLNRLRLYGGTLLAFHSGVAVSYIIWKQFGGRTSWFCLLPIAWAIFMLSIEHRRAKKSLPEEKCGK
jgi:uncharacterized membrane protein YoaK (UPF0700 family)